MGERFAKKLSGLRIEAMCEASAVDVQGFEDLQDGLDRDVPLKGPVDDVKVFLARLDTIEDSIEQQRVIVKLPQEEAEIAAVQLDPEPLALQVLQPTGAQIAPPMTLHPSPDGGFTKVAARFLALNPFVAQCFLLPI